MKLLFDLDGTLCDPREGILNGFRHAFGVLGLPSPTVASMEACIGLPLKACFLGFGLDSERSEEGARCFQSFFEGRGFAEGTLYAGVKETLGSLRSQGHRLAIVSAKPAFAVRFVAESLDLLPYFDGFFGCAPKELAPQKAPILAEALKVTGWDPGDCLFIGDRAQDRDAAAAHGIPFVAASWGFGLGHEHKGAVAVLGDIRDLEPFLNRLLPALAPDLGAKEAPDRRNDGNHA
jgi:phosphoglycolate phosphatase